ncbi:MAG TPA: DUF302 domain-containing protein [Bacteroidales bacterium]|nr:DUF302 domain-containing protein [Bacteroidales bacterium]
MNMKNLNYLFIGGGFLAGIVITILVAYNSAPGMMLKEAESKYGFEQSVEVFEQTVLANGWKIPKVHDMRQTMETFGKHGVKNMKVFELCHPTHAYEILSRDDERIVSSLMPCRVSIYEKSDGKTYVSWMNTSLMGNMMGGVIADVMGIASAESLQMISSIKK